MEHLNLSVYGEDFMSIMAFDSFFNEVKKDLSPNKHLVINFNGVNYISPSFMTRLLNKLQDDLKSDFIEIENANSRLETTFKFALHSIKKKTEMCI